MRILKDVQTIGELSLLWLDYYCNKTVSTVVIKSSCLDYISSFYIIINDKWIILITFNLIKTNSVNLIVVYL